MVHRNTAKARRCGGVNHHREFLKTLAEASPQSSFRGAKRFVQPEAVDPFVSQVEHTHGQRVGSQERGPEGIRLLDRPDRE